MTETAEKFYADRDDRTMRYAGRILDPSRRVIITGDAGYLATRSGQAALLTLSNLLGRMTPNLKLGFDDFQLTVPGPAAGRSAHEFIVAGQLAADPYGAFGAAAVHDEDYAVHLGPSGSGWVVHGAGWSSYVGPAPSPLHLETDHNPIGGMLAAIIVAARLFVEDFPASPTAVLTNAFDWTDRAAPSDAVFGEVDLGVLWFIGAGSVGTAAAYFLALSGAKFRSLALDMDKVKTVNLDRSPIFVAEDRKQPKVDALVTFLRSFGLAADGEPVALNETRTWHDRPPGTPDVLISAANEQNVRYQLESGLPPIQLYATTGKSGQVTLLRHIPPQDPCSCCIFPPDVPRDTDCATGTVPDPKDKSQQVDAALPFMSFAAGLMTAAELIKLRFGRLTPHSRVAMMLLSDELLHVLPVKRRPGCVCTRQPRSAHRKMVASGPYADLYAF